MGASESTVPPPPPPHVSGDLLWKAADAGDVNKVRAILEHPAVHEIINYVHPKFGTTPLMAAAACGKHKLVALLVNAGAALSAKDTHFGNTALHLAAYKNKVGVLEKLLQANGCDAHVWNREGFSPLDAARLRGHREAVNVFVRHLALAKGWLFMKKGRSVLSAWKKRWCMIFECSHDHSALELAIYHHCDDVKPTKVLFLTASENATSPRSANNRTRHRTKHSFSFTSTTTFQVYGQESFSRSVAVRQVRHIPIFNASAFRFATETPEGREKWIELLGPLAFASAAIGDGHVGGAPVVSYEDEPILEPTSEPTPLLRHAYSSMTSQSSLSLHGGSMPSDERKSMTLPSAPPFDETMMMPPMMDKLNMDMTECIICMDKPRSAVSVPCGHLGACYDCLVAIQEKGAGCPMCRQKISAVVRVYTC
ncbi:Aste57867_3950 [Aphanomyces stellatus]|uniref:Aste57867_3950 protein n=1 Tax=Aphanomyces stellatus TaxID=120398 RepID=A0A485KCA0_9STRA|nr:hypothetical protein As57867_003939 [Aphanomyces stellatus]VFT81087.1 Aste57867_3950 [Aphanomyces stellatus]